MLGALRSMQASPSLPPPANLRVVSSLAHDDGAFPVDATHENAAWARAQEAHFWHRTRNRFVVERLQKHGVGRGSRVIELGCGDGGVALALARAAMRVTGVEGHLSLATRAAHRVPEATFIVHDLAAGTAPLGARDFDAACFFDVLEHLDDPGAALNEAVRCVRPGGVVVGTVPALMALWSAVDARQGHRLRYERSNLRTLVAHVAGTTLLEVTPFNRCLVPLLWAHRRRIARAPDTEVAEANLRVPTFPINAALHALVRAEHRVAPILDRTALPGASLWFALRRLA